jgi:CheY-like chemotaxis protein
MPGIDGWETCRQIKADPVVSGIKVYMVTAKPIDSTAARAKESGANGYLLKPFRPEDLLDLVREVETGQVASSTEEA